eukprot:TRINITY_DN9602_c0_g1_i1.p2 TRINITY_DN9602_c0_g1~~TRINITY_DN9602_c0_g1_i1.p2  ORF type:complete len:113 (-),score=39.93 TRINITY_DN9602_c0_g1_i1:116-454(-)
MSLKGTIEAKLAAAFAPSHCEVTNESFKHSVPEGSETHFQVVVVSDAFEGKKVLERHRMVNDALQEEFRTRGLHALSITARTPDQWGATGGRVDPTPPCLGGSKADRSPATP